jgi:hypothetical protein
MDIKPRDQSEAEESNTRYIGENDDSYKQNSTKRINLINRVLENIRNSETKICDLVESKMKETIISINHTYSITETDRLHSELRILDWIFFKVCSINNKIA